MSGSEEQGTLLRLVRQSGSWSSATRLLILSLVVLAAYPGLAALASSQRGTSAWLAAALAAGICWLGAMIAMAFPLFLRGAQAAPYAMLFSLLFRMGLPLASALMAARSHELKAAGFFGLLTAFYLITLAAETLLVLPLVRNQPPAAKGV